MATVQSRTAAGVATLAYNSNVTAGNVRFCIFSFDNSGGETVSGVTGDGTWSLAIAATNTPNNERTEIWYIENSNGGNTTGPTISGTAATAGFLRLTIGELNNVRTSGALDRTASRIGTSAATYSGDVLPTTPGQTLVGALQAIGVTITAGNGWTIQQNDANQEAVFHDRYQGPEPVPVAMNATLSGSTNWIAFIVTFKAPVPSDVAGASTGPGLKVGEETSFVGEAYIGAPVSTTTQTLTLGLLDDSTDTFFAPTITTGAVTVTLGLLDDSADTFFAPQVNLNLTLGYLDDSVDTFFAPQLNLNLTLGLLVDNIDDFYSPTITTGAVTVTLGYLDDSADTFFDPTVSQGGGTQSLILGYLDDSADTFFGPQLNLNVTLGYLDDGTDTFFAPALAQNLTLGFLDDATDTFFNPVVTVGAVTLTMGHYIDPDTFFPDLTVTGGTPTATGGPNLILVRRRRR